jgi:hypothetical protein
MTMDLPAVPNWANWMATVLGIVAGLGFLLPILRPVGTKILHFLAWQFAASGKFATRLVAKPITKTIFLATQHLQNGTTTAHTTRLVIRASYAFAVGMMYLSMAIFISTMGLPGMTEQFARLMAACSMLFGTIAITFFVYRLIRTSSLLFYYEDPPRLGLKHLEIMTKLMKVGYSEEEADALMRKWSGLNDYTYRPRAALIDELQQKGVLRGY